MNHYSNERNVELHFIAAAMDHLNQHKKKGRKFDFLSPTTQEENKLGYDAKIQGYKSAREVLIQFKSIKQKSNEVVWKVNSEQHEILVRDKVRAFYVVHPLNIADANWKWQRSTTDKILKSFLVVPAYAIASDCGTFGVKEARSEKANSINGLKFLNFFTSGHDGYSHELNLSYADDAEVKQGALAQLDFQSIWGGEILDLNREQPFENLCALRHVR